MQHTWQVTKLVNVLPQYHGAPNCVGVYVRSGLCAGLREMEIIMIIGNIAKAGCGALARTARKVSDSRALICRLAVRCTQMGVCVCGVLVLYWHWPGTIAAAYARFCDINFENVCLPAQCTVNSFWLRRRARPKQHAYNNTPNTGRIAVVCRSAIKPCRVQRSVETFTICCVCCAAYVCLVYGAALATVAELGKVGRCARVCTTVCT